MNFLIDLFFLNLSILIEWNIYINRMEYVYSRIMSILIELFTVTGNTFTAWHHRRGKTEIVGRSRPRATLARPRLIAVLSFGSTASLSLIQLSFISGNATSQPRPAEHLSDCRAKHAAEQLFILSKDIFLRHDKVFLRI